jgi:hypothetical protein
MNENFKDEITEKLTLPYLFIEEASMASKINLAIKTLGLDNETLIIPASSMFSYSAILAGISERQVEYVAKNAPSDYKKELLNSIMQPYKIKEIFEIARAMDTGLATDSTKNQERVQNVIQYIKDNRTVFEF